MINIIVAEPNCVLRIGIRAVLERQPGFFIAEEVSDAEQFCSAFLDVPHDVVLIEMRLVRQIGSAALRDLRQVRPASRFLVHSYEIDTEFGADAVRFGITGYFANDCSSSDLCAAVVKVAAGQPFVSPVLGEQLAASVCFRASNLAHASLDRRELVVFKMLSIGLKPHDVARQLGKSVDTIHAYRSRIMAKMDVPGANDLVRHAIAQSVVKPLASDPDPHPFR